MNITVNGKNRDITTDQSLKSLIEEVSPRPEHTIAELNGVIIKPDQWQSTTLASEDKLELMSFVGGG